MTVHPSDAVAPAGWYPDPLGIPQLRWWNGGGWTNHVQEERIELQTWGSRSHSPSADSLSLSA
jgi:hypothetical protein